MFGRGTIAVMTAPEAVVVPQEAVVTESGTPFVWVVEAGRARRRPVRLGLRQGGLVQVLGVRPGEAVVVLGSGRLRDGAPVSVQP
jgi:multidrug efflux pump subunit AcrA (membrane-fusion protein)